jgi:hypothetical protein
MARTIAQIKKSITDAYILDDAIIAAYGLTPGESFETQFSSVSIENIVFYAIAFCIWFHEQVFEQLKADVLALLDLLLPHTAKWYVNKAKNYLHGFPLYADSDKFNTTGYSPAQILAAKVVKHAAAVEQENAYGRVTLRIKAAREVGNVLEQLTTAQLNGLRAYFVKIKDAGVKLQIDSLAADGLKLSVKIYYDPLILNSNGQRLDGLSSEPVQDAIRDYLKNLPFNGVLILAYLTDALQAVEGVVIPEIMAASAQYGLNPYSSITTEYNPDAGYLKLYNESTDLLLTFVPHNSIL